jgi:hypothetical protein
VKRLILVAVVAFSAACNPIQLASPRYRVTVQGTLNETATAQATHDAFATSVDATVPHHLAFAGALNPANGTVELYRVVGGGHTWPGATPVRTAQLGATTASISATTLILRFFDTHPRLLPR